MKFARKDIADVIEVLMTAEALKATKYVAKNITIKAKRKCFKGRIDHRDCRVEIVLTMGSPNYAERAFIKDCIKAGEKFPIKNIQLKY